MKLRIAITCLSRLSSPSPAPPGRPVPAGRRTVPVRSGRSVRTVPYRTVPVGTVRYRYRYRDRDGDGVPGYRGTRVTGGPGFRGSGYGYGYRLNRFPVYPVTGYRRVPVPVTVTGP